MGIPTEADVASGISTLAHVVSTSLRRTTLECGSRRSGMSSDVPDPTCSRAAAQTNRLGMHVGIVIRSGIGSYDCEVQVGSTRLVCGVLTTALGAYYGASQASMPIPGTCVVVLADVGADGGILGPGYIVGMYPGARNEPLSTTGTAVSVGYRESPEGGVSQTREHSAAMIASDKEFQYHGEFRSGRPADLAPGEYALLNTYGGGVVVGALTTQVRGSEFASVQCSALDDQVRVLARNLQCVTGVGSTTSYCDGPHLTSETSISTHLSERLGLHDDGRPFTAGSGGTQENPDETRLEQKRGQTAIARIKSFTGYLGDVVNTFVVHPGTGGGTNTMDSQSDEQGLLHLHVDTNGRAAVRSASGITLERYDRIPVPQRRHQTWDPEGDVGSDVKSTERKEFDWQSDKYPGAVGLVLGDMSAWWSKQAYARFTEFEKDFTVRGQSQLEHPDPDYDKIGKARSDDFDRFADRHSYFSLTPDGGIVLRDAWGSEIVMQGGNITFNAAHDIYVRPGRSAVTLAGDDVILKAYNSIDATATTHDVRIKAQNNLQLAAIKRGVLIESQSKDLNKIDWTKQGEDLEGCGVFIHAADSVVHCVGKSVNMSGTAGVNIDTFNKDGTPSGDLRISSRSTRVVGTTAVQLVAGKGDAGVLLQSGALRAFARSTQVIGSGSLTLQHGKKFMQGMQVDGDDLYGDVKSQGESVVAELVDSTAWVAPYNPEDAKDIAFGFRTDKQYATDPLDPAESSFRLYKPAWVLTAESNVPWAKDLTLSRVTGWTESEDTHGEYPWPGKQAYKGNDAYVVMSQHAFDNAKRCEKDDFEPSADLTARPLSEYHILRQQDS